LRTASISDLLSITLTPCLNHDIGVNTPPTRLFKFRPTKTRIQPLLIWREKIDFSESKQPGFLFDGTAQSGRDSPSSIGTANKNTAEPRRQVFVTFEFIRSKCRRAKNLTVLVHNQSKRQLYLVHVLTKLLLTNFDCFVRQDVTPMLRDFWRQLQNEIGVVSKEGDAHNQCGLALQITERRQAQLAGGPVDWIVANFDGWNDGFIVEPNSKNRAIEDEMPGDPVNTIKNPSLFICDQYVNRISQFYFP
jgi:hypothetical protein